jgi:hypothetical protein
VIHLREGPATRASCRVPGFFEWISIIFVPHHAKKLENERLAS